MTKSVTKSILVLACVAGLSAPAAAQQTAVTGAAAGAATGALVGGPVGAVVGGAAGLAAGTAVDAGRQSAVPPGRTVVMQGGQPMVTGTVGPRRMVVMDPKMQAAWDRCAKLYKSFNPSTGTFVGEDGLTHVCQ